MKNIWKKRIIEALKANELVEAQKAVISQMPKKLFKHFSVSKNTFDSLEKGAVWLSDPSCFNDPYDSSASLISEFIKSGWEEELLSFDFTPEELNAIKAEKKIADMVKHQADIKHLRASLRICSFSEIHDSILMWSHYADQHKGICVGYDLSSMVSSGPTQTCLLYPVIYSKNLFDIRPYLSETYAHPLALMLCSLHKFDVWSYEKEWRLITAPTVLPKPGHFPIPNPTAIYLGSRIRSEDRKSFESLAVRKNIKLFESDFDPYSFTMKFSEIGVGSTQ